MSRPANPPLTVIPTAVFCAMLNARQKRVKREQFLIALPEVDFSHTVRDL